MEKFLYPHKHEGEQVAEKKDFFSVKEIFDVTGELRE